MTATRSARSASRTKPLPERHARGQDGEEAAARWLVESGYSILWRNLRIGPLEIDIVAKKDDLVVIVEVRTRGPGSFEGPLASLSRTKRRSLLKAARGLYRGRLSKMRDVARVRIDVAAVTIEDGRPVVEWIPGAITEQDG